MSGNNCVCGWALPAKLTVETWTDSHAKVLCVKLWCPQCSQPMRLVLVDGVWRLARLDIASQDDGTSITLQ